MCSFWFCSAQPGTARPWGGVQLAPLVGGDQKYQLKTKSRGQSSSGGGGKQLRGVFRCCYNEFKKISGHGSKQQRLPGQLTPTCQRAAGARFLICCWLSINAKVNLHAPTGRTSPRRDVSCPTAPFHGAGSCQLSSWGHGRAGDRQGGASRGQPPPARTVAAPGASSPRAAVAVAQAAHAADVPAAKQNKQTKITALGFPRFDSVRFNFGNLALGCSKFTGGGQTCCWLGPSLCTTAFGVLCPLLEAPWGLMPLPCAAGLRTWDGVSWISSVHSPAALSPQQCTVMNSQPLKPSLEWSKTLRGAAQTPYSIGRGRG